MKLGSWLIAKGKISGAQLKRALLDQSFYGGRLSTSLIKLGYLDDASLGEYLSELFQVPYAGPSKFNDIPSEVLRMVPRPLAEKYQILPLGLEGKKLQLAMMNPKDILVADEVAFLTGLQVTPWVSSEDLLLEALERYHQVPRPVRETIPMTELESRFSQTHENPAGPMPPLPPDDGSPLARAAGTEELGLDGLPMSAPAEVYPGQDWDQAGAWETIANPPVEPAPDSGQAELVTTPRVTAYDAPLGSFPQEGPAGQVPEASPEPDPPSAEPSAGSAPPATPPSLEEATLRMRDSTDRDEVFDVLLDFCAGSLERVALFVVLQDRVIGWSGRGPGLDPEKVRSVEVSFDTPSVFSYFRQGSEFYFGPVPEFPANQKLYRDLGIRAPYRALLVPLQIKGRLIALLYGDGGESGKEEPDIGLFRRVASKAALALEILILRNKLTMI